jgi:hypothetical protein
MAEPNFRALCAELVSIVQHHAPAHIYDLPYEAAAMQRARSALDQPEPQGLPPGYIDPEHTGADRHLLQVFYRACQSEGGTADEINLRGIRAVLADAALAQPEPQGESCPGCEGTPSTGNSPCAVCGQLAQPEPQGPTDKDLHQLWLDLYAFHDGATPGEVAEIARAVLQRWGRPAIEPVPVTERLPGPEDCIVNPRTGQGEWCWGWAQHDGLPYSGRWRMMRSQCLTDEAWVWLPHYALPVPQQREVE